MGNIVCCANNPDEMVESIKTGDIRKPKLFGAVVHASSSDEGSDNEKMTIEGKFKPIVSDERVCGG